MKIIVTDDKTMCEFYGVSKEVGNAIITLLHAYEKEDNKVVSVVCEDGVIPYTKEKKEKKYEFNY